MIRLVPCLRIRLPARAPASHRARVQNARDRRRALSLGALLLIGSMPGCVGVGHDLHAVGELYRDARYEEAQAWFAALRASDADMDPAQRTKFHYLSGMTAYRLAQPQEATHELALAAHGVREQSNALDGEQLAVLYRTLEELKPTSVAR
jgi:hypothetical protein